MTRFDDLPDVRMTRAEALRDQAPDTDPPEPAWARCSRGALINAQTGRCGHAECPDFPKRPVVIA